VVIHRLDTRPGMDAPLGPPSSSLLHHKEPGKGMVSVSDTVYGIVSRAAASSTSTQLPAAAPASKSISRIPSKPLAVAPTLRTPRIRRRPQNVSLSRRTRSPRISL